MLMSMIAAPFCSESFAASAISCGVQPTSCIETGSSVGFQAAFWIDWRVSRIAAGEAIISVTLRPEPKRRTSVRNGISVTPVIGARMTGQSIRTGPTWIGFSEGGMGNVMGVPKKQAAHSGLPSARQAITGATGLCPRAPSPPAQPCLPPQP